MPTTPAKLPETWFRTFSITGRVTPKAEQMFAGARQCFDNGDCLRAEWHLVGAVIFHPLAGQADQLLVEVNFAPTQTGNLAAPLAGKNEQFYQLPIGRIDLFGSAPYAPQLIIA